MFSTKLQSRELRDELSRLMTEHVEALKAEAFGGATKEELRLQIERLNRIRDVSDAYLASLETLT